MSAEDPGREGSGATALRWAAYALLAGLAILAPIALAEIRPSFVSMSYGTSFVPFELLGLFGGAAIGLVGAVELRRRRSGDWAEWAAVIVPCLLSLHVVTLQSEYAQRRFDYDCYEYAGRALLAGESPYQVGLIYLYPPLTAQGFAAAHTAVAWASERVGISAGRDAVWDRVFFLYQCAQVLLVLGAYGLLLRLARELGLASPWGPVGVGLLLLFANPLFRTLRHGQINLWVLNLALLGLVFARRRPAVAGSAIALAAHVKLYPLLLLAPALLCGYWRTVAWAALALGGLVLLGSDGGRDWTLWSQYLALAVADFPGETAFRNNSLHSLAANTSSLVFGGARDAPAVGWAVRVGTLACAAWALHRLVRREQLLRGASDRHARVRAFAEHGADALAFALLLSPSVWEHHYLMALPLALAAAIRRGRDRPGWVALGLFLALAMPTFDLFPLGYHRMVGLLLLLAWTTPRAAAPISATEEVRTSGPAQPAGAEGAPAGARPAR